MEVQTGVLLAAGLLGASHAAEPDHVAGIAALASEARPARAALVGTCFAAGHVLLVVAWVAVAVAALSRLPAAASLDRVGAAVLGAVLLLVAAGTAAAGVRSLRGGGGHAHVVALAPALVTARPTTAREYLLFGVVGALFSLSPPVSMLAFVTGALPASGTGAALSAVVAYAVAITAAMALVGAGAGVAFDALRARGRHVRGLGQLVAAAVVGAIGVAVLLGAA